MTEFRMPALGADMEAGTLVEWLKKPGDRVARGDILAVVDTEKGAIEIEVFEDGVLDGVVVQPGQKVPVGTVLAMIRPPEGASEATATGPRVSPAARRPALAAAPGPTAGMRTAIGAAMARAKREIPHLYLSTTIDLAGMLAWLATENERRAVTGRLLPALLFIKAVARACVEVPALNGFWTPEGFAAGPGAHIGCAIALRGGGLVAPALRDVDRKALDTLAAEFSDLVKRARTGGLRSSEMSDATITVTNLGDLGVETAYAIIYPPQVAVVGVGRIVERPWVVGGRVEPRSVVTVSVSADHRAADGRQAGLFLTSIDRALQAPERL